MRMAILGVCLLLLSSCGIKDGIDQSNQKQEGLLTQLQASNQTQNQLLENMKAMLTQMQQTNSSIHLQALVVSLDQMIASAPDIFRMGPPAVKFGQTATPDELLETCNALYSGALAGDDGAGGQGKATIDALAAQVLFALAPDDSVNAILASQVQTPGKREDTVLALSVYRYDILGTLLDKDLAKTHKNVPLLQEVVGYLTSMDTLRKNPAANLFQAPDIPDTTFKAHALKAATVSTKAQLAQNKFNVPEVSTTDDGKALLSKLSSF